MLHATGPKRSRQNAMRFTRPVGVLGIRTPSAASDAKSRMRSKWVRNHPGIEIALPTGGWIELSSR